MSTVLARHSPTSRYRPPPRRRDLEPLPPKWVEVEESFRKPPLAHFVFLSMLLHVLFIALFGAPAGGTREGRAVWGALNVVIQGGREAPTIKPIERPPVVAETPPRPAILDAPRESTVRDPVPKAPPEPYVFPPLLDRIVVPEPAEPPPLLVPPPTGFQVAPPPLVAVPAPIPRSQQRPVERPLLATPSVQPAPPPKLVVPAPIPRAEQRPVDTTLVPAPAVERAPAQPMPVPAAPTFATPAPIPRIERQPVEAPPLMAAPRVERAPVIEPIVRPVDRALTQEIAAPVKPPTALERALTREPQLAPPVRIEPATALQSAPAIRPAPFGAPGTPSADTTTGRPREPSTTYDPTAAPKLDIDGLRKRAGQIGKEGTGNRALLPFPMPPVEQPKNKIEKAIENARKPDCRDHYKSLGLAAIVPLIANEFGEGRCRW